MVSCCLFGSKAREAPTAACSGRTAQAQALDGLEEMLAAYRKVAQLTLPPGAAAVFAKLRRDLSELEAVVAGAAFPETRPWRSPLAEEQQDWAKAYPAGGILLRRQLCSASKGDEDWFLGGLFISDVGIAFDTGSTADDAARFQTGLLAWKDIASLQRPGPEAEILMSLAGAGTSTSQLRLQLTIPSDAEWLEEFWKLQAVASDERASSQPAIISEKAVEKVVETKAEEVPQPVLLHQLSRSASAAPEEAKGEAGNSPKAHRSMSLDSKVSGVYNDAPGGRRAFQLPQGEAPVNSDSLPSMDVAAVKAKLESENWLSKFLQDSKQAHSISATPWSESKQAAGVLVRKATFTLPVPQDFPRAVTRLVNLPTETKVTAVFRLHPQPDQLVFTVQMCSHDIPYGENFRVHETVVFKADSKNGVETQMWVEVLWIASLPWTHGVLKNIIEQKSKADGMGTRVVNMIKKQAA